MWSTSLQSQSGFSELFVTFFGVAESGYDGLRNRQLSNGLAFNGFGMAQRLAM
jgi:hypothetical protein